MQELKLVTDFGNLWRWCALICKSVGSKQNEMESEVQLSAAEQLIEEDPPPQQPLFDILPAG